MNTQSKLPVEVYVSKKTCKMYPLTEDGKEIDLKNELTGIDLHKYNCNGDNNVFRIYELKERYR